ncbi:MAG TPA: ferredoxin--NADP reductase [Acidimicrobiales bacterium]|nr:ferredoxin--NADP reductase [Acidimicrobiales bacterium]
MGRPEPILSPPRPRRDHGFHPIRVAEVVQETADAVSLVLEVPTELADVFAYEPGQFCNLRVAVDGEPQMRCYSMSSAPVMDEAMQVTVKRVPGGIVSNWIVDRVRDGDTVELSPPTGFFQLTDTAGPFVAFAAGSGITPVLSLVKTALVTTSRVVRLHYANRDAQSVIFDTTLSELETRYPDRLTVVRTFDVEHGLLTADAVTAFADESARDGEFYLCGPGPYMEVVEQGLGILRVEAERIRIERFAQTDLRMGAPPAAPEPAQATRVTIELDGRTDVTDHRAGTTILQTARQMGMAPPFSCESGSCATCMARIVEGSVSMFVNNALTPEEVEEGWILTCQSVPTSAAVRVVYGFEED